MEKTILKYIVICTILILPFACTDFLDEANPNEMSTDNYWKTLEDCDQGLIAVYNAFKNQNVLAILDEYNRSDMTWPGYGRPNTTNSYYLKTFTDASDAPNKKWDALYTGIFRANQVIGALDNLMSTLQTTEDQERAVKIMGQARFFRGLFYFYLYNSFNNGSVIIYDQVSSDIEEFYMAVQPAEKVREFFTEDLEYAYQSLPAKWSKENESGRVTAGAAAAVLGKSYLYEKEYETAAEYFKDIIENPIYEYKLTDNIGDNFTSLNELNSESILEIVYSLNYKAEISPYSIEQTSSTLAMSFAPAGSIGGYRSLYPSCWLIMAYKKEPLDINDPRNYVTDASGSMRLRTYSLRASYSIALVDDPDLPYYGLTCAQATSFNNSETAYWRKYTNWDIVSSEKDIVPSIRSGVNVRVIRLADVYLMYAECLIKGGTDDSGVNEAMKYINKVRHRSALQLIGMNNSDEFPSADHNNVSYNAQLLIEHLIYVERPLELSAEGNAIRTIDLRRWGITKQRFEELSNREYYKQSYKFTATNGSLSTRWGAILTDVKISGQTPLVDYVQAATNYNETDHAYWPIPNSELISNPKLNKN